MSEQGSRRPLIFAATGIAAGIVLLLAYSKYNQTSSSAGSNLHRSNAIRRPRRRWRRGFAPRELDYKPLDKALQDLRTRIAEAQPYGRYDNQSILAIQDEHIQNGMFDLLPDNLASIYTILSQLRPMSDMEKEKLRFHISSIFVQNFLLEEFPAGWIIGEDVEALAQELGSYGIDEDCTRMMVHYFDSGKPMVSENWDITDEAIPGGSSIIAQPDGPVERTSTQQAIAALDGHSHTDLSDDSDDDDDESDPGGSQNMLDLLYHIASEQAKREGFIHRDVICNSCAQKPIQGIRYHCANCFDYDLCEDCEAQQVHNKTHVFYKVRIPAPPRGRIKQVVPVWYPGQPNLLPNTMPRDIQRTLVEKVGMDKTEMAASYEQYKCLAGEQIPQEDDPVGLGVAISRANFDMFFTTSSADRPPPPNLIHDRIFAFYDFHNDGVITLDEYIIGIFAIMDKSRGARLKRMFKGYDLDSDGYVDRKDFLRMFRAYYALSKEHNREMISLQDELDDEIHDAVQGSGPISAAFSANHFLGHNSRSGQDKIVQNGDFIIAEGPNGVLQDDSEMRGDRTRAIGNAAVRDRTRTHPFRSFRPQPESDEQLLFLPFSTGGRDGPSIPIAEDMDDDSLYEPSPSLHIYGWPPRQTPEPEDIFTALGVDMPVEDVTDPVDRSRVIYAQVQRLDEESDRTLGIQREAAVREVWRRRQFQLDEEEGLTKPPGYTEPDSSDDDAASIDEPEVAVPTSTSSRRQSMRSRSSSKVRFEDSAIDTDHETRSNTSSRSIPMNERWGGFELSAPERDIGREILYQAVQRGFNELLDPLFKAKEDEALESLSTKAQRLKWSKDLDEYDAMLKKRAEDKAEALRQADMLRTQALFSNGVDNSPEAQPTGPQARPSTPATDQDDADHIQIMFGNSLNNTPEKSQLSVHPPVVSLSNSAANDTDPTLPQNKPNDPDMVVAGNTNTAHAELPDSLSPAKPSEGTLDTWLHHRKIEEEAHKRGGYGKLSYREFCRIMIKEANRDKVKETFGLSSNGDEKVQSNSGSGARTGARTAGGAAEGQDDGDSDDEIDEQLWWSSTGDLGNMSFCGAWLEMSQF